MSISTASQYTNNAFITYQTGTVAGQTASASEAFSSTGYRWGFGSWASNFSGTRYQDTPINFSMTPGNYWIGYAFSSSSTTSNTQISQLTRISIVPNRNVLIPQISASDLYLGTDNDTLVQLNAGIWVNTNFPTTSALDISQISNTAPCARIWWSLLATA